MPGPGSDIRDLSATVTFQSWMAGTGPAMTMHV